MIPFESFVPSGDSPIYLQIIRHIKRGIAAGTVVCGDELPSRRLLSALLGVNPNTVQKAFHLLEEEGLVESRSGAKSFVTIGEDTPARIRNELTAAEAEPMIRAIKETGLSKEEAMKLFSELWDK